MFEKVKQVISSELNIKAEKITEKSSLADFGVDSLDMLSVITKLEEDLNIIFPDEIINMKTVKDLVDFCEKSAK
jgi:acyl carrier protein